MKRETGMPRATRPHAQGARSQGAESVIAPAPSHNLVVESITYHITSQSMSAPQAGGRIMPEGFLTETGLRRFW
jgi:hypothetical protein